MSASTASAGLVSSKTSFSARLPARWKRAGSVTKEDTHRARLKRMRRTLLNTARLLESRNDAGHYYWVMVTLTYAPHFKWESKHVSGFIQSVRHYCRQQMRDFKLHYCWVMELQKRGAPHYHVLLRLPHGFRIPKPDEVGWWFLGFTNVERARHAIGYLAKYASKGGAAHEFPHGARIHGASDLKGEEGAIRRWWNLPVWAREIIGQVRDVVRCTGGVIHRGTGHFWPSPWLCTCEAGLVVLWQKEP